MSHKNRNKKKCLSLPWWLEQGYSLKRTQEKENLRPSKGSAYKNSSYGCGLSSVSCGRAKESLAFSPSKTIGIPNRTVLRTIGGKISNVHLSTVEISNQRCHQMDLVKTFLKFLKSIKWNRPPVPTVANF